MISSEWIGLAAVLLSLIVFALSTIRRIHGVILLLPMLAASGMGGYASASIIGMAWTIGLALLLLVGVICIVLVVQKREDRQIEQQFEKLWKPIEIHESDTDAPVPPLQTKRLASISACVPLEKPTVLVEENRFSLEEAAPLPAPSVSAGNVIQRDEAESVSTGEDSQADVPVDQRASDGESPSTNEEDGFLPSSDTSPLQTSTTDESPSNHSEESMEEKVPADMPRTEIPLSESANTIEPSNPILHLPEADARADLQKSPTFESDPPVQAALPAAPFSPDHRDRVQTLSETAEQALQQGDYLSAYRCLKEALSYSPPLMAKYLLSRQLVQVLNEMGLYEESIAVMKKMLDELPVGSTKKRDDLTWQISYLEKLSHFLVSEQKQNLSWSLIPAKMHQRVMDHVRAAIPLGNERELGKRFQTSKGATK